MKIFILLLIMMSTTLNLHSKELSVLFIGNSFTFMNNMPEMFQKIATSNGDKVVVEHCTKGGMDWKYHVENDSTYEYIDSRDWDYIVLQAKSWEPAQPRNKVDANTLPYGQKLVDAIRRKNPDTRILLYMTWGYQEGMKSYTKANSFYKMYSILQNEYLRFADVFTVAISPVGEVWKNIRELSPQLNLYEADKFHPNIYGSYISACTFYVAIFRKRLDFESTFKPASISLEHAKLIQSVSYGTVLNPDKDWRFYNFPGELEPNIAYEIKGDNILLAADAPGATKISWYINGELVSNNTFFSFPIKDLNRVKIKLFAEKGGVVYKSKEKVKL